MAYEPKKNTGILNQNDKGDNPKRPDYKGSATIEGVEYWISGWKRVAKTGTHAGETFLSLVYEAKEKPKEQAAPPARPVSSNFDDEEVPF